MLHVTNGDNAAARIRRVVPDAEVLPWRDMLHDGPVPCGLAPDELSEVRARFIAEETGLEAAEVRRSFRARDARLGAALEDREELVLWFEHDLYDQLQLLQILAGLPERPPPGAELICVGSFPGRPGFAGLGELEPDELASLWPLRVPLTHEHTRTARAAWDFFRGADPRALARLDRRGEALVAGAQAGLDLFGARAKR